MGPDGWLLMPEGAAVHQKERTAVIADVHLGYEWARGGGGDCLPAHSIAETLAKLTSLLQDSDVNRLVVAGDLVESAAPCRRTASDVRRLRVWLGERGLELIPLAGNHDPAFTRDRRETVEIGGWTIAHGHRPIGGEKTIHGHFHPVLRAGDVSAPCFLIGPRRIVLPAFSPNAAGATVVSVSYFPEPDDSDLRCVAALGSDLFDFGPLGELRRKIAPGWGEARRRRSTFG
jgi:putative SbcD/Mre11-related phosphoesterase